jgi:hypothetical protein
VPDAEEKREKLFTEADRQLVEQRARLDSLTTRAGLLTAAMAVVASLIVARYGNKRIPQEVIWTTGISLALGIIILATQWISPGPRATKLATWSSAAPRDAVRWLFSAKVEAIEGNALYIRIVEVIFWLQALSVTLTAILTLVRTGGR